MWFELESTGLFRSEHQDNKHVAKSSALVWAKESKLYHRWGLEGPGICLSLCLSIRLVPLSCSLLWLFEAAGAARLIAGVKLGRDGVWYHAFQDVTLCGHDVLDQEVCGFRDIKIVLKEKVNTVILFHYVSSLWKLWHLPLNQHLCNLSPFRMSSLDATRIAAHLCCSDTGVSTEDVWLKMAFGEFIDTAMYCRVSFFFSVYHHYLAAPTVSYVTLLKLQSQILVFRNIP